MNVILVSLSVVMFCCILMMGLCISWMQKLRATLRDTNRYLEWVALEIQSVRTDVISKGGR